MSRRKPAVVWALSSGSYSDYRVHAICLSEADAQEVQARHNATTESGYDRMDIEQILLADASTQPQSILNLTVNIYDDGTTTQPTESVRQQWPWDWGWAPPMKWRWVRAPIHQGKGGRLEVSGSNHKLVRKVFSDRRAMLLAGDPLARQQEAKGEKT